MPAYYISTNDNKGANSWSSREQMDRRWLWENTLAYEWSRDRHILGMLVGVALQQDQRDYQYDTRIAAFLSNPEQVTSIEGSSEAGVSSYFGRMNYSFANRYLLTASLRADRVSEGPWESSLLTLEESWKSNYVYQPAVSAAWRLKSESFLTDIALISDIKLRGGWGKTKTPVFDLQMLMTTGSVLLLESVSRNVGMDIGLWGNRFTASVDYFVRDRDQYMGRIPLPPYGFQPPVTNIYAQVHHKGVEVSLGWHDQRPSGFKYHVAMNLSHIKSEIGDMEYSVPSGSFRLGTVSQMIQRETPGAFYGYVTQGIFQSAQEVQAYAKNGKLIQPVAKPGDFRFADLNGDGTIDAADRRVIGSPLPTLLAALNISASFKQLDFSMFWQASLGNDIFDAMRYYTLTPHYSDNRRREILNSWTPGSGIQDMPILAKSSNGNDRISDWYVVDGSYLRLKQLQIGYSLPEKFTRRLFCQQWRWYIGGSNLLTFTSYKGLDPEIGIGSSGMGVDIGNYPMARVWTIGTQMRF